MNQYHPINLLRQLGAISRPVRHAIAVPALESFRLIAGHVSHRVGLCMGRWIGWIVARFDAKQRFLAMRQLKQSGISEDPADLRRLSNEIFIQIGMGAAEALRSLTWTPEEMRQKVRFERLDQVQAVHAQGEGFIIASAHMGNWELLLRVYHAHTGQIPAAVMATQTNDLVTRWLVKWRQNNGQCKLLPSNETLAIVRHLRGGGALIMGADQDTTRSRGIFVNFFGRPAYTPVAPAKLARRNGVALIPLVIVRESERSPRHQILIADPIRPDPMLDEESDILSMTQAYTNVLEGWIRQYPAQWMWIHDRWRHRPGQKIRIRGVQHNNRGSRTHAVT